MNSSLKKLLVVLLTTLLLPLSLNAAEEIISSDPFINRAHVLHQKAQRGGEKENKELFTFLEKEMKTRPHDTLLKCYLGSSYTLKARDGIGPMKLFFVKKGIRLMNEAVETTPRNPMVRFVRGATDHHLPDFLEQGRMALDDFEWLLDYNTTNNEAEKLPVGVRQNMLYFAGLAFKKHGKPTLATKAWTAGQALDDQSEAGKLMQAELLKN
jgi:hypothetical protein